MMGVLQGWGGKRGHTHPNTAAAPACAEETPPFATSSIIGTLSVYLPLTKQGQHVSKSI